MKPVNIPVHRPAVTGGELRYLREAIASGRIGGDGPFCRLCEQLLEETLGVPRILLTPSGTHALEIAAELLGIGPGDEFVVPSFTYVSSANAFVSRGARPIFIDVREDTLNLDESLLRAAITPRTRMIVPVHYSGVTCNMAEIGQIAKDHRVHVVEDNAHGLFGHGENAYLGTYGTLAVLSFHATKNLVSGEGGALVINDSQWIERAEILRQNGTDRSRFLQGRVDAYRWHDVGTNGLMSDLLAAVLYAQLLSREKILNKLYDVWRYYDENLRGWADMTGTRLPAMPSGKRPACHLFYLRLESAEQRRLLHEDLRSCGIDSSFHFVPLHLSPMGRKLGYAPGDFPVTEKAADCLLRLPFYYGLSLADQRRIVRAIIASTSRRARL